MNKLGIVSAMALCLVGTANAQVRPGEPTPVRRPTTRSMGIPWVRGSNSIARCTGTTNVVRANNLTDLRGVKGRVETATGEVPSKLHIRSFTRRTEPLCTPTAINSRHFWTRVKRSGKSRTTLASSARCRE